MERIFIPQPLDRLSLAIFLINNFLITFSGFTQQRPSDAIQLNVHREEESPFLTLSVVGTKEGKLEILNDEKSRVYSSPVHHLALITLNTNSLKKGVYTVLYKEEGSVAVRKEITLE